MSVKNVAAVSAEERMPSNGYSPNGSSAVTDNGSASEPQNTAISSVAAAQRVAGCDSALLPDESSQGDNSSGVPTRIHPCRETPLQIAMIQVERARFHPSTGDSTLGRA